jgi:hypothetical protein
LHISVATHYCSGREFAAKVSLSGKLASCGMEHEGIEIPLTGIYFTKQCCSDEINYCRIDNNYTPSFTFIPEYFKCTLQVYSIPDELPAISAKLIKPSFTNGDPPGVLMSTNVDLSDICTYRI